MLNVGDKVVYPGQGVGIISGIEEREFKGKKQHYYNINIINGTMKLKLPVNRVENINIRLVSESEEIDNTFKSINNHVELEENLQKSYKKEREENNNQKVKSGTFEDYLSVVCNLTQVKNNGNVNAGETQTLNSARGFVVLEISQSKGMTIEDANEFLDGHLNLFSKK